MEGTEGQEVASEAASGRWLSGRGMRRGLGKLLVATVVVEGCALGYNRLATAYMRYRSTSVVADFFLRLVYFGFMTVSAGLVTLLADEIFFHGQWRRRVLSGLRGRSSGGEEESPPSLGRALFRDYTPHVSIVFLVALGLHYVGFNAANGWFDSYYRKIGYWVTALRSGDSRLRIRAIGELAPRREGRVVELLVERLARAEEEERLWAIWALGYRGAHGLLDTEREGELESRLMALADGLDWRGRGVLAVALARLGSYGWLDMGLRGLESEAARDFCLAFGLARDRRPRVVEALWRVARKARDLSARLAAAWALGQMRSPEASGRLAELSPASPPRLLCVAVDGMRWARRQVAEPFLLELYRAQAAQSPCRRVEVALRPDGKGDRLVLYDPAAYRVFGCVSRGETLRVRILKVLGARKARELLPWIRRQAESRQVGRAVSDCAVKIHNMLLDSR